jgi:Molybdopterin oxidoreductase
MQRLGMSHLKWLVVRDLNLIESATWWKDGPEIAFGELRTEGIETEVFFLPAAAHVEKAGSFTQTQRLLQWRHHAVAPPGDCQSDLQFFVELSNRIRQKLAGSTDERDRPLLDLTWDYPTDEHGDPDPDAVLAEINGYHVSGSGISSHAGISLWRAVSWQSAGITPSSFCRAKVSSRNVSQPWSNLPVYRPIPWARGGVRGWRRGRSRRKTVCQGRGLSAGRSMF